MDLTRRSDDSILRAQFTTGLRRSSAGRRWFGVPVVALVCSAGGLEPLCEILADLPRRFPAAVIVLRHQSPTAADRMAPILRARTALRVKTAADGDALVPGRVLVAPAGNHTLVSPDGMITLIDSGERPPYRPSADLLLTTLAMAAGPRAIAVVLSGYGNDGATGASVIHRLGGVVIASDAATSPVFAMPQAAIERDAVVDHVVPVGAIAALLQSLAERVIDASGPAAG
ncbi:chemotaxis protein CheB [Krasilnikovia cinnamomea]|nr:chemotaxis protein CheB [Krasilnikovia cinnamomea]